MKIYIMLLSMLCITAYGMKSNQQKYAIVQRKAAQHMLSKLLFRDNERVLCIGDDYGEIIKKKVYVRELYRTEAGTLSMMEKAVLEYDKIISFVCLDVVRKPQEIFNNSARLLKWDGRFCAIIPYYKSPYLRIHYQTLTNNRWKNRYDKNMEVEFFGSKQMKSWLRKAGFDNVECRIVNKAFRFKTRAKFARWIMDSREQFVGISQKYHQKFVNDVVNNYMQRYPLAEDRSIKLYLPY